MLRYATTFLSHSSLDHELVEKVHAELGRRGILAWLDRDELPAGRDLPTALRDAIERQATFTAFLSRSAVRSSWMDDELGVALRLYDQPEKRDLVIPVFLDEPLSLLRESQLLKSWIHPDGDRVSRKGIHPPPGLDDDARARYIAEQLADSIYRSLGTELARNIVIHLDQRGSARKGVPSNLSPSLESLDGVGLVFRPRTSTGARNETIVEDEWNMLASTIVSSLGNALRGVRWSTPKNVYVTGNAQLGFGYLLGHHFDRGCDATLFCLDRNAVTFTNKGWERTAPLSGGDPHCEASRPELVDPLPDSSEEVAIIVGRSHVVIGAGAYLKASKPGVPLAWIPIPESPQNLVDSDEVHKLVADLTALCQRLSRSGCRRAYLMLGLPLIAVPLVAAHMVHIGLHIVFLEYRRDLCDQRALAGDLYAELSMP